MSENKSGKNSEAAAKWARKCSRRYWTLNTARRGFRLVADFIAISRAERVLALNLIFG